MRRTLGKPFVRAVGFNAIQAIQNSDSLSSMLVKWQPLNDFVAA